MRRALHRSLTDAARAARGGPRACHLELSERQRPADRKAVELAARRLLQGAAAIRISARDVSPCERPGEAARRGGEAPGAADDCLGLPQADADDAAPRIDGERLAHGHGNEVHAAGREHEIVATDVVGIAGQVLDLDDPTAAAEHAPGYNGAADDDARARRVRRDDGALERLVSRRLRG